MADINSYFLDYEAYHQTKGNKYSHILGIPLIVLSLLGLLNQISFIDTGDFPLRVSPALALWLFGMAFYAKLHFKLGFSMMISTGVLYAIGIMMPVWALWALFVAGWVAQGVGHAVYEKRSPAFLRNFTHILVGPAYIQNHFFPVYVVRRER